MIDRLSNCFSFPFAMSVFATVTKNKIASICKCLSPQTNVNIILCTVIIMQFDCDEFMLISAQKHGTY